MSKVNAALIGSGNIGTDLMIKALRSEWVSPLWMAGIDEHSDGLAKARDHGLETTHRGVQDLLTHIKRDQVKIVFDATSAQAHPHNDAAMKGAGVKVIDLTPAAIGPFCVPSVNLDEQLAQGVDNVNMVTCGGQATIPMVAAISRVQDCEYAEVIATISSRSAGPGTRRNIDEFTRTTARAIESVGGAGRGKAIIILNPAEPPLMMRDTVHCLTADAPKQEEIIASVKQMVAEVQTYVPGYRLVNEPVFDGRRVSLFLEVQGLGDYLPQYAGNLDIMTAAALKTAEMFAQQMLGAASNVQEVRL